MIERIEKPWGWYENLQDQNSYKVKRLYVKPNEKISLQYHNHRAEHWVVVFGNGVTELDGDIKNIKINDYIFVPIQAKHRITAGKYGIIIVEIQIGLKCEEEDIVRIEDAYGRI